jgi:ABC-type nitrate/sulfonate/bicarbonate transport system substrate-binding protein
VTRPPAPTSVEQGHLKLGIMPLTDAAPIIIARDLGYFAKHGVHVDICLETSWAAVRDKLAAGLIDAAHMLAPMPLAAALGVDGIGVRMVTALSLNLNGNAITVSKSLYERLGVSGADPGAAGLALKRVLEIDRAAGTPPHIFAHVYPFSAHHYELRYWLAGCGIDPDHDLELVVIPPAQMVEHLREGRIDGFCVGAPWSTLAEASGIGRILVSKHQIWNNSPEKVLGVTEHWADLNPQTHVALVAALIEAARWLDMPENRGEAARLLASSRYLDAPAEILHRSLNPGAADPDRDPGLVFHAGAATFPWRSHAQWFLQQMRRWKHIPADTDIQAVAAEVYRPDLYRIAALSVDEAFPKIDVKPEGLHAAIWQTPIEGGAMTLGADRLFNGDRFDPI